GCLGVLSATRQHDRLARKRGYGCLISSTRVRSACCSIEAQTRVGGLRRPAAHPADADSIAELLARLKAAGGQKEAAE
ncbi:MAG: hypothetical protein ACREFA_03995, partial [Stellaceae bacterium]